MNGWLVVPDVHCGLLPRLLSASTRLHPRLFAFSSLQRIAVLILYEHTQISFWLWFFPVFFFIFAILLTPISHLRLAVTVAGHIVISD